MFDESCASDPVSSSSHSVDVDSSSSSSSPYWNYLDSMILSSKTAVRNEKGFLNEVCYQAGSYKVIVGLSVARGMLPSVRLINTLLNLSEEQTLISLVNADWYEFLEIIIKMNTAATTEETMTTTSESENFVVSSATLLDDRIIRLKYADASLYFTSNDVNSIVSIKHLINYRLELVLGLQFRTFYDDTLKYVCSFITIKENFIDVIVNLCYSYQSECSYYLLELLHNNPKQVLDDFDKICICTDV